MSRYDQQSLSVLLGRSIHDPTVASYIAGRTVKTNEYLGFVTLDGLGIELSFVQREQLEPETTSPTELVLEAWQLRSPYHGELYGGVTFGQSSAILQVALGSPAKITTFLGRRNFRYLYEGIHIGFQFDENDKLDVVSLNWPARFP